MNRLFSCLLPTSAHRPLPATGRHRTASAEPVDAADAAATTALAPPGAGVGEGPVGCGWFDSTHELRQGLAVQEWPAEDWATAALYFGTLAPAAARLQ